MRIISLYSFIGDVENAIESYQKCRIKNVQLESLSYVYLPLLLEYGYYGKANTHYMQVLHFHKNVAYDTNDQLAKAYVHCNYMKCIEMHRFIELCKS